MPLWFFFFCTSMLGKYHEDMQSVCGHVTTRSVMQQQHFLKAKPSLLGLLWHWILPISSKQLQLYTFKQESTLMITECKLYTPSEVWLELTTWMSHQTQSQTVYINAAVDIRIILST